MRALLVLLALFVASPALAQSPIGMADEAAFVEHRLALQISDNDPAKQTQILNNAFNVLKAYGPDKVAIEVVAFGPGVDLLHDGNVNAERISSLVAQGVKFDVCMNTVETIERNTGKPYALNEHAIRVPAGIVQLITLAEHGYAIIRP